MLTISLFIDLILLFCATFCGDYAISEVPVFFWFWLLIFVFRRKFTLNSKEVSAQMLIIFLLLPIILQPEKYELNYYFGAYYAILYVNVIVFADYTVKRLLSNSLGAKLVRWLPFMSLLCIGVLVYGLQGLRQSLVFGPNVFYRIIGIIFLLHFLLFQKDYNGNIVNLAKSLFSLLVTFSCLALALYVLVETGSRGASIVGLLAIFVFTYSVVLIKETRLKLASIATLSCLISIFLMNANFSDNVFSSRAFIFKDPDPTSHSIRTRLKFLENLFTFFLKDDYLLGEGSNYIYHYPHNLYLDLLYNAGIFPFLILVLFSIWCIVIFIKGKIEQKWKMLALLMLPIYIGSLVSGTLYDNYSIISLIIMLPIWKHNQTRKIQVRYVNM